MLFNERLRKLRERSNLTQQKVADQLSLDRSTYAYYELGSRMPDLQTLTKLSEVFEVTTDYLLGIENLNEDATSLHIALDNFENLPRAQQKEWVRAFTDA